LVEKYDDQISQMKEKESDVKKWMINPQLLIMLIK